MTSDAGDGQAEQSEHDERQRGDTTAAHPIRTWRRRVSTRYAITIAHSDTCSATPSHRSADVRYVNVASPAFGTSNAFAQPRARERDIECPFTRRRQRVDDDSAR